ncbi:MAG: HupE/UreJ family protein [Azospirillaceae bacterium]|nr:HupE/UreJ family protein [Azospirillaceae bacterium]
MSRPLRRAVAMVILVMLCGVIAGLCLPARLSAHTRSESYALWEINGAQVHLTLTVPILELDRIPMAAGGDAGAELRTYLATRVGVSAGDDAAVCPVVDGPHSLAASEGYARVDWIFRCDRGEAVTLHFNAFFDLVPAHVGFARIRRDGGAFSERLFTQTDRQATLSDDAATPLARAGWIDFITMGIEHILTGVDHMAFLLGLTLLAVRLRDLALAITGFTLGHSVTLALSVLRIVRPEAQYIEALIGLTIAVVAAEGVVLASRQPAPVAALFALVAAALAGLKLSGGGGLPVLLLGGSGLFAVCYLMLAAGLQRPARLHFAITAIFGLVHGFGFANALVAMKLPADRLAPILVGFNVGVEIGQLVLVGVMLALGALVGNRWRLLSRINIADYGAASLVGLGLFWFVSRGFVSG